VADVPGASLERARAGVLHVLEFCRDDHAIVVAAIAWPDAYQLISLSVDEGNAAFEPLEAAGSR
jgi:hypothetical protein